MFSSNRNAQATFEEKSQLKIIGYKKQWTLISKLFNQSLSIPWNYAYSICDSVDTKNALA